MILKNMYKKLNLMLPKVVLLQLLFWVGLTYGSITFFYTFVDIENTLLSATYFIGMTIIYLLIIKDYVKEGPLPLSKKELLLIGGTVITHLFIYGFILTDIAFQADSVEFSLINANNYFLYVKPLEVFVQQLAILWLVLILHEYHYSFKQILTSVLLLFGGIHLIGFYHLGFLLGSIILLGSLIGSIVFPLFFLKCRNGLIHGMSVHMGFYYLFALALYFFQFA